MDMKRDYYEDVRIFTSGTVVFWTGFLFLLLAIFPFVAKNYWIYVANYMAINVIVVVGLNILVGYTGQISMGHAGFYAIGAYSTIFLMTHLHFPFLIALPCAGLIAAFLGFLLGLPALRLEGPYLAIATLGFGVTITQIIGKIKILGERQGLHAPDLHIGGWQIATDKDFYFVLIPITVFLVIIARNIIKTKVGRAFISIRDAEIAASTVGVNLTVYKTLAFAVSAFYAAVGGGLYAFVLRFIEPELFSLFMSVMFLTMVTVGGLGSIMGSVCGACLLSFLDIQLRNVLEIPYFGDWIRALSESFFSLTGASNIQLIIFGLILIFIMLFEPLGIFGMWIRAKKYWLTWPF